jgi:hypothetical protein
MWFWAAKKQTQFKANQSQTWLAPRFILGVEKEFEKTNPICAGTNWRKVLYKRVL